jgi:8-oxo-dGTP pyrophosphatase MutT (NUDIX family)
MIQKQELIQLIEGYSENDTNKALTLLFLTKYDDFWSKKNTVGQITCACWVVNKERTKALMTHHLKLNRWLQLGGHLEAEDNTIVDSCIRELKEESGLNRFDLLSNDIFDMDVHKIPTSKKGVSEHFHFDVRMLFEADENESIQFDKSESNNVKWMAFEDILKLESESITRMVGKTLK